jgi:hypothetical protein
MSDDIVKRLRAGPLFHSINDMQKMQEAANEIDRLRTELDAERDELKFERHNHGEWLKVFDARTAERDAALANVAKLRKALEPFVASAYRADSDDIADIDCIYVVVAHLRHARTVLEETNGASDG